MKFKPFLLLGLLLSTTNASASEPKRDHVFISGEKISFEITANGFGNLTYQLDCVSGFISCTEEAYQQLWKSDFSLSDTDQKSLKNWRKIKDRYGGALHLSIPNDLKPQMYPRQSGIAYEKKLRIVGLASHSVSEFREKLRLLMRQSDADDLADIAERFLPRFEKWWNHAGFKIAQRYEKESLIEFKKLELLSFFEKVANFYQSKLAKNETIIFNIIARAPSTIKRTAGEHLENYSTIEATPEESPDSQVDVIAHEAFHHLYELSTIQDHVALIQRFIDSKEPYSVSGYNLLNESLATVFGNGLVKEKVVGDERFQKLILKPNSFYNNEGIDRTAKALLPVMRDYLQKRLTINSPEFVSDYLKAYQAAVGSEVNRPAYELKNLFVLYNEKFHDEDEFLVRSLKTNSSHDYVFTESESFSPVHLYPYTGSIFLISKSEISGLNEYFPKMKNEIEQIKKNSEKESAFIFGLRTNPKIISYVLVAETKDDMKKLAGALSSAKSQIEGFFAVRP